MFKQLPNMENILKTIREKQLEIVEDKHEGFVSINIPVFIRFLEIARENLKSDNDLHIFVEKIMEINDNIINMDNAKQILKDYEK